MNYSGRPTVGFYTLGCKVNQNETEALSALFQEHSYHVVDFEETADVYVINTCTVTHLGDRKSRQMIRRAIKRNQDAVIVVTGCYAQASSEEIAKISGVDLIIGTRDRASMIDLIENIKKHKKQQTVIHNILQAKEFEELPSARLIKRTRAYLKVQEGCDQFCTYCIIPYTRGAKRSRKPENALKEAKLLVQAGFKELILTGIHLGAYGVDLAEKINLTELCEMLLAQTGIERLRLSSIEPTEVTDKLLSLMADDSRFCRHLHIPLQNGDDDILKRMNRPYSTEEFRQIVYKIRNKVPDIGLTSDIMVGFPGESEENFANSLAFVKEMSFSGLHVFKYSPRKGTPASKFSQQIPAPIKEERSKAMLQQADESYRIFANRYINKKVEVLVETEWPLGGWEGHTDNFLKVVFEGKAVKGEFAQVKIMETHDNYLLGKII